MARLASARITGKRALSLVIAGLLCMSPLVMSAPLQALPVDGPVLRIQGSNTVGAKLAPMLLAGMFEAQGLSSVRISSAGKKNEQRISAVDSAGRIFHARVAAHGTGTGFAGLKDRSSDLAAA